MLQEPFLLVLRPSVRQLGFFFFPRTLHQHTAANRKKKGVRNSRYNGSNDDGSEEIGGRGWLTMGDGPTPPTTIISTPADGVLLRTTPTSMLLGELLLPEELLGMLLLLLGASMLLLEELLGMLLLEELLGMLLLLGASMLLLEELLGASMLLLEELLGIMLLLGASMLGT